MRDLLRFARRRGRHAVPLAVAALTVLTVGEPRAQTPSGQTPMGMPGTQAPTSTPTSAPTGTPTTTPTGTPTASTPTATTFATAVAPTGIMVEPTGNVLVVTEPQTGTTLVSFTPQSARSGEVPLTSTPPGLYARSRLALVQASPTFTGAVLLTPTGILVLVPSSGDVLQLDLTPPQGTAVSAPDVDASGAAAQLALAGAHYDDVAFAPASEAMATANPGTIDLFITGATAASGGGAAPAGGQPFILRARIDVAKKTGSVAAVATSQGTVTDPAHRSGVGVFFEPTSGASQPQPPSSTQAPSTSQPPSPTQTPSSTPSATPSTTPSSTTSPTAGPPRPSGPPTIVASMPTKTTAAIQGGPDVLVALGAGYPEDPKQAPIIVKDGTGKPFAMSSPGMTTDAAGNLYVIGLANACTGSAGPGLLVVAANGTACAPLPPSGGVTGGYADVAVLNAGDPVYVTDDKDGLILRFAPQQTSTTASIAAITGRGEGAAAAVAGAETKAQPVDAAAERALRAAFAR